MMGACKEEDDGGKDVLPMFRDRFAGLGLVLGRKLGNLGGRGEQEVAELPTPGGRTPNPDRWQAGNWKGCSLVAL